MEIAAVASDALYLGIDGGGSKCKVVLTNQDMQVIGEGLSGPANPLRGMTVATASIVAAAEQALDMAALPRNTIGRLIVGAGLAGVNLPEYYQQFSAWQHPFAQLYLTSDLHIACIGAHCGGDGAVIICGTGSCGLASVQGQLLDVGGHGFPYGDSGSGAWFGLQLVHTVLRSKDGLTAVTLMTALLEQALGVTQSLDIVSRFMHASPTDYARFAPLVFAAAEQGDALAQDIIVTGSAYINEIAQRLLAFAPEKLALIGGLAEKVRPYLAEDVKKNIVSASQPPELGAVWFAKQAELTQVARDNNEKKVSV